MRVDKEEIVLSRLNGASSRDQNYQRHKDSYFHDKNNEIHGMELRKLSMVIFLNDNLDPDEEGGMLRLYPQGEKKGNFYNYAPRYLNENTYVFDSNYIYDDNTSFDEIVDISPRMGRAVMFKSEEMLH